jgi:hypothetical protein
VRENSASHPRVVVHIDEAWCQCLAAKINDPFGIAVDFWCDGGDGVAIRLWLIALATSTGLRSKGDPNLLGRPGDPELDQLERP